MQSSVSAHSPTEHSWYIGPNLFDCGPDFQTKISWAMNGLKLTENVLHFPDVLITTAPEGWGKVMFSVCPYLWVGGVPWPGPDRGGTPARSGLRGYLSHGGYPPRVPPGQVRMGGTSDRGCPPGVPPARSRRLPSASLGWANPAHCQGSHWLMMGFGEATKIWGGATEPQKCSIGHLGLHGRKCHYHR